MKKDALYAFCALILTIVGFNVGFRLLAEQTYEQLFRLWLFQQRFAEFTGSTSTFARYM